MYIEDEITRDIQDDTVIYEELRVEATATIKENFSNIGQNDFLKNSYILKTSSSNLLSIVNQILQEIVQKNESISLLADILITDDYTYQHSLNVAIYALTMNEFHNYQKQLPQYNM